jgi:hypothetical protein
MNINDLVDLNLNGHNLIKTVGVKNYIIYRDSTYKCVKCNIFVVAKLWGEIKYNYTDGVQIFDRLNCEEYIIKSIIE